MNIFTRLFTTRAGRIKRARKSFRAAISKQHKGGNPSIVQADIIVTSTGEVLDISELVKSLQDD